MLYRPTKNPLAKPVVLVSQQFNFDVLASVIESRRHKHPNWVAGQIAKLLAQNFTQIQKERWMLQHSPNPKEERNFAGERAARWALACNRYYKRVISSDY